MKNIVYKHTFIFILMLSMVFSLSSPMHENKNRTKKPVFSPTASTNSAATKKTKPGSLSRFKSWVATSAIYKYITLPFLPKYKSYSLAALCTGILICIARQQSDAIEPEGAPRRRQPAPNRYARGAREIEAKEGAAEEEKITAQAEEVIKEALKNNPESDDEPYPVCSLCLIPYDNMKNIANEQRERRPLILCSRGHICCATCSDNLYTKRDRPAQERDPLCPFGCNTIIIHTKEVPTHLWQPNLLLPEQTEYRIKQS